jgi:hypothetical protein
VSTQRGSSCGNASADSRVIDENRRELVGFGLFLALDADQIIEDCVDVLGADGRLVGRAHLLDFGPLRVSRVSGVMKRALDGSARFALALLVADTAEQLG